MNKTISDPIEILRDSGLSKRAGISEFCRKVLLAVSQVKRGEVMTYGELARRIGKPGAARAVGKALNSNPWPVVIPCHRIVPSSFPRDIGGYKSGVEMKRRLLAEEGVYTSGVYGSSTKSSLPTPHTGQTQSAGISSKAVPGAIPESGSPTSGS